MKGLSALIAGSALAVCCIQARVSAAPNPTWPYSPVVRGTAATNLYWGDLHLHTNLSADAFLTGTRSMGPDDAFRFAMGEQLVPDGGEPARLRRPLDFLAVTDHAEYLGVFPQLARREPALMDWRLGAKWAQWLEESRIVDLAVDFADSIQSADPALKAPPAISRSVWTEVADRADRYNRPGLFTALIGYEWTSMINGDNLHRVVLFRGDAQQAKQVMPFSAQDSTDPERLWDALDGYAEKGVTALAIAHNGNVSNGRMFSPTTISGQPLNAEYAQRRQRWEPVYEVTQIKGDGETHPYLSPDDPFADFETWDEGNISLTQPKQPWMLQYEYARSALREGLRYESVLGINPFKFGMVGGTDSHTGLSTTSEDNFFGKFLESEPDPERWRQKMAGVLQESWKLVASGLTAVWAPENTREAIFDALERREVYATTGSRIGLRFFGGWDFAPDDIDRPDFERVGYAGGVPMGGDLPQARHGAAPRFLIRAAHDPDAAFLDRVQVIKGWLGADGQTHEKVFDVALSDGRMMAADGTVPPVGNTVNVADATWRNSIGDPELATWWEDPAFNPLVPAFYYVRVIEIPRPRWTAYDAAFFDLSLPSYVPMTVQDRAYSSPIWYRP